MFDFLTDLIKTGDQLLHRLHIESFYSRKSSRTGPLRGGGAPRARRHSSAHNFVNIWRRTLIKPFLESLLNYAYVLFQVKF